jgi:hypothetical protein
MINLYIYCEDKTYKYFEDYVNSLVSSYLNTFVLVYNETNIEEIINVVLLNNCNNNKYIFVHNINKRLLETNNKNIYFLNTEQLSHTYVRGIINNLLVNYDIKLIDYSLENLNLISNSHKNYLPYQVNLQEIYNFNKKHNILMLHNHTAARTNILNQFTRKKIKVDVITDKWGVARDNIIFKYKILVNLHQSKEHVIFEQFRCLRMLVNKIIIISEDILNKNLIEYSKFIIFVKYEDIVETTQKVLNNYDYYYDKLFKDFDVNILKNNLLVYMYKFILEDQNVTCKGCLCKYDIVAVYKTKNREYDARFMLMYFVRGGRLVINKQSNFKKYFYEMNNNKLILKINNKNIILIEGEHDDFSYELDKTGVVKLVT